MVTTSSLSNEIHWITKPVQTEKRSNWYLEINFSFWNKMFIIGSDKLQHPVLFGPLSVKSAVRKLGAISFKPFEKHELAQSCYHHEVWSVLNFRNCQIIILAFISSQIILMVF